MDHSGELAAGSVIEWANSQEKSVEELSSDDFESYYTWCVEEDPIYEVSSSRDFGRVLGWLTSDSFCTEAHDLYLEAETMAQRDQAKRTLTNAIQTILAEEGGRALLEQKKEKARQRRERDDLIWFELVLSHGTQGNSAGATLATDEETYDSIRYDALKELDREERRQRLEDAVEQHQVNYPNQTIDWMLSNLETIDEYGGVKAATEAFERKETQEEKMKFLAQFKGIGDKYQRNIGMDIYHPDFRDTIAIDDRVQTISELLGVEFDGYNEHEEFYQSIAEDLNLEPWELDRLMYNFKAELESRISEQVHSESK